MARGHRPRDARALPQLDAEFHGAILELSGNTYLRAAYWLIEHKIHALRWRLPENNEQVEHCQDNHVVIVDQIRDGNVGKAQTTLKRHIRETYDAYIQASRTATVPERRPA
jgi:DNA-binding GntR family transcriptional regulator